MSSVNAKAVADDILTKVRKGQKVNLGKILKARGYSDSISRSPSKVTRTRSYKYEVSVFVRKLINAREQAASRLSKTIKEAKYRDLIDGIDKITKNVQLLTGRKTENAEMTLKWK